MGKTFRANSDDWPKRGKSKRGKNSKSPADYQRARRSKERAKMEVFPDRIDEDSRDDREGWGG